MAEPISTTTVVVIKKVLKKIAVDVATDKESRRRWLIIILAPVGGVVLLTAFIMYLLTNPLSFLMAVLSPSEIKAVEEFRIEYGYTQRLCITEQDYLDGSGIDYGEIIFTDGITEVVYFNQLDTRFAEQSYGTDMIGTHGCGPTALAIVVSSLTDRTVDPAEMAAWSAANSGWAQEQGSFHSLIPAAARAFGLNVTGDVQATPQAIIDALNEGRLVIALMGRGSFTTTGRFIVLRGVTAEGKILVADPVSLHRSQAEWDFALILNEARRNASDGGAFWVIG
jgi:hypothetical protein